MTTKEHDAKYPEHVKLRAVSEESQKIGAFLDWLLNKQAPRIEICEVHGNLVLPTTKRIEDLLGEYFDIDPKKLSAEKDVMVEDL